MKKNLLTVLLTVFTFAALAQTSSKDISRAKKLIQKALLELTPPQEVTFRFHTVSRSFGHLSKPWETNSTQFMGGFSIAPDLLACYQIDSTQLQGKYYSAYKFFSNETFVNFPYGRTKPSASTTKRHKEQPLEMLAFYPAFFLKAVLAEKSGVTITGFSKTKVSSIQLEGFDDRKFILFIDSENKELKKIVLTYPHELYGDVTKTFLYNGYIAFPGIGKYPGTIVENELNVEKNRTTLSLTNSALDKERIQKMVPSDYTLKNEEGNKAEEVVHTRFNDNIHLLELKHTDDRVLVVEFKDFLVVAEAPVNTRNGELIIQKAKEIAPGKPVRYFLFGHHHPHYIGGIRAFVHAGATVLALPQNEKYIRQLVSFDHAIRPDILQKERKELTLETFNGTKHISDGALEMQIMHIGKISDHTEDYLVYYFPKYKLLFEDDLAWINREGELKPAGSRQKGLYDAITNLKIPVEQIIQSWPVQDYGVKTLFSFQELEQSVKILPVN
jgi:glyoxylase-like metal-dependent hydrolase (beta-lactamase superfamily II)